METDKEKQCIGATAAVKEGCRIFCTTFLSLLPLLSLLLFARISAAMHQTSAPIIYEQPSTIVSILLHTKTTLILSFLVFAAAVAAVIQGFAGDKCAWLISKRRRLQGAVVWLLSIQICLSLWIHAVAGGDRIGSERFGNLVFLRSLVLALGLHETVVLWRRNVVKPVVDEAVFGFSDEGFNGWVEEVVLAAAVGCLWWRRVRREAEELVVMRRDIVEVVDVWGWLLYGLTAAVGGVRVVKGLLWVVNRVFRRSTETIKLIQSQLKMENQFNCFRYQRHCGGAAMKEGGRILATTFLSLLPFLSFLLLARLSAARFFFSAAMSDRQFSLHSKTTSILSFVVFAVAIGALVRRLNGNEPVFVISKRRRSCMAWVLISLMQVCLSLGIHGTADGEISGFAVGNMVLPRRVVFVLGLHEITVFWRRSAVAPVVEETVAGFSREGFSWVEEAVLAAAFGNLWWRRLRDEAEALVALPWVRAELEMDVEVADIVGWLLYYLTAAIGGVRVVNGVSWAAMWIFGHRRWLKKKGVSPAVNISVMI